MNVYLCMWNLFFWLKKTTRWSDILLLNSTPQGLLCGFWIIPPIWGTEITLCVLLNQTNKVWMLNWTNSCLYSWLDIFRKAILITRPKRKIKVREIKILKYSFYFSGKESTSPSRNMNPSLSLTSHSTPTRAQLWPYWVFFPLGFFVCVCVRTCVCACREKQPCAWSGNNSQRSQSLNHCLLIESILLAGSAFPESCFPGGVQDCFRGKRACLRAASLTIPGTVPPPLAGPCTKAMGRHVSLCLWRCSSGGSVNESWRKAEGRAQRTQQGIKTIPMAASTNTFHTASPLTGWKELKMTDRGFYLPLWKAFLFDLFTLLWGCLAVIVVAVFPFRVFVQLWMCYT